MITALEADQMADQVVPVRRIRPPDPAIVGKTMKSMPIDSHDATRRLINLAFRDAHTAIDLTYARGGCWKGPLPPGLSLTTSNLDPTAATDLHLNYLATGLDDESFDLVVFDPVHLADAGQHSIMRQRFGTVKSSKQLRAELEAGALEAWRIARLGIIVKVTDHSHGLRSGRVCPQCGFTAPLDDFVIVERQGPDEGPR